MAESYYERLEVDIAASPEEIHAALRRTMSGFDPLPGWRG
jgi:DnaJ-class molecular chaperone